MKRFTKNIVIYLVIFAIVLAVAMFYKGGVGSSTQEVKYSTMIHYLEKGQVSEVTISDNKVTAKIDEDHYVYTYANNIIDLQWLEEKYAKCTKYIKDRKNMGEFRMCCNNTC